MNKKNIIMEVICSLLAILFVYASVSKLLDYDLFKMQLAKSPFITGFSNVVAIAIPIIEIITTVLLTFGTLRLFGLYTSLFLLTLFTEYLVGMLNFSYYIPCSCGGVLSTLSWKQHILFNLFFLALAITGILLKPAKNKSCYSTVTGKLKSSADKGKPKTLRVGAIIYKKFLLFFEITKATSLMKRLKISWLMTLAVLFAVASAFTTNHVNKTSVNKAQVTEVWYPNDAHNTGNPLSPSQVDGAISYTDAQVTAAFLSQHCPPPTNIICLAKFQQGPTGSQIDFKTGRYQ